MTDHAATLATVTGASGFIAQHCVKRLLEEGYRVRGTLRRLDRQAEIRDALAGVPGADTRLEFCEADLTRDAGWLEAIAGCTFVLHTASPVPAGRPAHDDDVIVPARDGTLRVLRAAAAAGVTRVVLTSSVAAVLSGVERGRERLFTEADWSDLARPMPAYSRSKTLAERAAWAFVDALPAGQRLELTTVNPSFVLGPSVSGGGNASNEIVRKVLAREVPGLPRLMLPVVDVRDVAELHLLAMSSPAAAGERFIASEGDYWYAALVGQLADAGFDVPTRILPDWLVRVVALFNPTVRMAAGHLGIECHVSSGKARRLLGWQTRPVRETLIDTAKDLAHRHPGGRPGPAAR